MTKLDYEERTFCFKEELTATEKQQLIDKMRKQGFDFGCQDDTTYTFIKFNRA